MRLDRAYRIWFLLLEWSNACLNTLNKDHGNEDCVPVFKVTIRYGGELVSTNKDRISSNFAPLFTTLNNTTVQVNIFCQGQPVVFDKAVITCTPQTNGSNQKLPFGTCKSREAPFIYFGPADCERNDLLARMFFLSWTIIVLMCPVPVARCQAIDAHMQGPW